MQIELNWRTLSYKDAICLECGHDTFWPANTGDLGLNYQLIIYVFPYISIQIVKTTNTKATTYVIQ